MQQWDPSGHPAQGHTWDAVVITPGLPALVHFDHITRVCSGQMIYRGAWLVTLHHMGRHPRAGSRTWAVRSAWILIYNPLLNVQEKVWPNAKTWLLYDLYIGTSEHKNWLTLGARFARFTSYCTWNPIGGSIQTEGSHVRLPITFYMQPPQDVSGPGWNPKYCRNGQGLMAFFESCLKFFWLSCHWEFIDAMPEDMWQIMRSKHLFFKATPNYYLIWCQHAQEPEMVALFQPA